MSSQIRRAVVSISSNIAEGSGTDSRKNRLRFLYIAVGSCNELENLVIISNKLGYIDDTTSRELENNLEDTIKPLMGLIKHIRDQIEN